MKNMTLRNLAFAILAASLSAYPAMARHYSHHAYYGPGSGSHYENRDRHWVHSPMHSLSRPSGARAHCGDGTWSFSQHHRGTCSRHSGVAGWR